ncbi:glutamate-5-semialdehyde dehydrogenase [Methanimicrococcus blatticola]|uniref:Gamma-glutamyl phosphate reductase n=1 Tax=Methanimicrococcus blatticola TaxID=91560 RepID=A0A484F3C3_9EURY|nr:glutamate-5-semialdehyde dehydrogenase [Methanimicrococcus blatticola]MBZ3935325.1 glutamate-5-semialdehyde dehydrogenase [Methanimicrococcus blatticola]MCC2508577.1 glutamate-5-semialdehyde dehydrogenase [Methanimicrococcus blatticola]TDQ67884.1 glutamate-5-semialdehyde dehydrogenase [Methanimicrococcus blatticola]
MGNQMQEKASKAKAASVLLANVSTEAKDKALEAMALALEKNKTFIFEANQKDLDAAKAMIEKSEMSTALYDRLKLSDAKFKDMVSGIRDVAKLEDPVGKTLSTLVLDDGLTLYQISCPIGVIGVIFEARPDVVPQVMSLCLKSGNATIFKGGSEAKNSNRALFDVLVEAMATVDGIPADAFQLAESREDVAEMLKLDQYIDLLIPRGSNDFVKYIQNNTRISVLGHTSGICHAYVAESADLETTYAVCLDSKIQYPAACNAIETLLVNEKIAEKFLPKMSEIYQKNGVELRFDDASYKIAEKAGFTDLKKATDKDWDTEYNDLILSVKIVKSVDEAIVHINKHGSHHTDVILSTDQKEIDKFTGLVDSSSVMINASSRFADGFRYGKGAEVGISTNKIHSRGPVGMEGLMIYKYILSGSGHLVKDYVGDSAKPYKHEKTQEKYCRLQ